MGLNDRRNKGAVLAGLAGRPATAPFIPETRPFDRKNLNEMAQRHPILYLKPNRGYQGKGVLRITRHPEGRGFAIRGEKSGRAEDPHRLWKALARRVGRRRFLLQQGIDSVTREGRPFDVRIHMQRLGKNWTVGGIVGRVGPAGGVTAGLIGGGKAVPLSTLLRTHLPCSAEKHAAVRENLKKAGIAAAREVGTMLPADREFAVDAGVDRAGGVWIFEVNYVRLNLNPFRRGDRQAYRRILANRRYR